MKYRYLLIALLFASFSVQGQKTKTANYSGVDDIHLATSSGSAKFIKGTGSDIKISIEYTYDDSDIEFRMDKRGSALVLEEKFLARTTSGRSYWTIEVPDGLDIRFTTGSGDLEIKGIDMQLRSNLGSGSVLLTDTKGDIRISTGSGTHEIENHEGDLDLTTGSGDIEVSKVTGDLEFSTGSGDITVDGAKGDLTASVGSGNIDASNVALNSYGRLTSGSGDVELALNQDTEARITLSSGSGDATLRLDGNNINAIITMEASERYGRIIAPFKFDSEEIIERSGNNNNTMKKTVKLGSGKADIRISTGSGTAEVKK